MIAAVLPQITISASAQQNIEIRPAPLLQLPSPTDSNSPAHWWNGNMVLFNAMGTPYRTEGSNQFSLSGSSEVLFGDGQPYPVWIEATFIDNDGTLFAWYHHEPGDVCPGSGLTAPKIGALVSFDNGHSFHDLGFVLESGDAVDCNSQNGYFAGGNGDFSVLLDSKRSYFYFLYSNYGGDVTTQGVAIARMAYNDRLNPRGTVWKYHDGKFLEAGLGGRVTPVFPANVSWSSPNTDAFWGPSIHWNTALNQYVMLLNRSCCSPGWPQEGIYISLNPDLSDPLGWAWPVKVLGPNNWYPQVIGEDPGDTDKVAGAASRLYVGGNSWAEMLITDGPPPDSDSDGDSESLTGKHRHVVGHAHKVPVVIRTDALPQ